MKIVYPYNEILPLKKAHDAYIIRNCASLAEAGCDVTLLCGKGSMSKEQLFSFYKINPNNPLKIVQLPILRRNNPLGLNWNFVFFQAARQYIRKNSVDVVMLSVLKLADFLLKKKKKNCTYLYEVHQLQWYPTLGPHLHLHKVRWERSIFERCDLITATTQALKNILKVYPYNINKEIPIVPLACDFLPLETKKVSPKMKIYYIGQLYAKQGLHHMLDAMQHIEDVQLVVVGGRNLQISHYENYCKLHNITDKVVFKGFVSPDHFHQELKEADAFVTTFENSERMPYVAHTKIYEYLALQKPVIAPDLDIVKEHAPHGILTYDIEQPASLVETLKKLQEPKVYAKLQQDVKKNKIFSWKERGEVLRHLLDHQLTQTQKELST